MALLEQIEVPFDRLKRGPLQLSAQLDGGLLAEVMHGVTEEGAPFIDVAVWAQRFGDVVEVRCEFSLEVPCTCSRCAEMMYFPLTSMFVHRFVPATGSRRESRALDPDDPDLSIHNGVSLNLTPLFIEHIVTAMPMAPRCGDVSGDGCAPNGHMREWDEKNKTENSELSPLALALKKAQR